MVGLDVKYSDSRESRVTSEEVADGDVKIEAMVTSMGKKSRSSGSGKRVHSKMIEEDLACLDWKKKNRVTVVYAVDDETRSVMGKPAGERKECGEDGDAMNVDVDSSSFSGMLGWLMEVAKDPCSKKLDPLPEWPKWKCCRSQEIWMQVLLAREVLFVKMSGAGDLKWQKNQRMHPFLYGDQFGCSYLLRDRLNCKKPARNAPSNRESRSSELNSSGAESNGDRSPSDAMTLIEDNSDGNVSSDSSTVDSLFCSQPRQRILLGRQFQAEVPKWNGLRSLESDSKWLGTKVWPLLKPGQRNLIERDPIGKGRQGACGCASRGSADCVRFHIAQKRFKLKMELGSAFFFWRFDKMGEEAILPWTKQEEDKFSEVANLNRSSEIKPFRDELLEAFPRKRMEELVGYYYNVFLLKRREHQNRHYPLVINSDDDDKESDAY